VSHSNPPSQLLWAIITANAGGAIPAPGAIWPVYVGHMPAAPDNVIVVYDTAGRRDGRLMGSGANITHPGLQVRVRAQHYLDGFRKISDLSKLLAAVKRTQVVLGTNAYVVASVTQTGDILSLGREPDEKAREAFTLNGTITFREA
jgi:hypothetical protein